jgi:UDP-N-acetylmuramate dehydrogenase
VRIRCAEPLIERNTLALPAAAEALAVVTRECELLEALAWARQRRLPVVPLGSGSNVVFAGDLPGLALCLANRGIEVMEQSREQVLLRVAAGENWHALVEWCLHRGYHGLENLALIPGTAGAAPIQNIGAYGVELRRFLVRVHAVEIASGRRRTLSLEECEPGYRDSVFKQRLRDQLVIDALELRLSRQPTVAVDYPALAEWLAQRGIDAPRPGDVFDAVVAIRRSRLPDPAREPNAGSFFKNPVLASTRALDLAARWPGLPVYPHGEGRAKLPAAWLIEQCGWKGHRQGGVGVHPDHALVIVHYGGAAGTDVLDLARRIADSVAERFTVTLEIEPRVYGR